MALVHQIKDLNSGATAPFAAKQLLVTDFLIDLIFVPYSMKGMIIKMKFYYIVSHKM